MAEENTNTPAQANEKVTLLNADAVKIDDTNAKTSADLGTPTTNEGATTDERPEWLPEKFKTAEDLSTAYTELEKKIGSTEKAPEQYDFTSAEKAGLQGMTEEQQTEASTIFKSYGLTQKQADGMLALYSDQVKQAVTSMEQDLQAKYPAPDLDTENNNLQREWGTDYKNNIEQVKAFTKNLPKELMQYPIGETAEGVKMLYQLMQSAQGPNPLANGYGTQGTTPADIQNKIRELRMDDKYKLPQGDSVGDAHRAEIYRLYQQLERSQQ